MLRRMLPRCGLAIMISSIWKYITRAHTHNFYPHPRPYLHERCTRKPYELFKPRKYYSRIRKIRLGSKQCLW